MIKARFNIGTFEDIKDTYDEYGFIYVSSDNIFAPPQKEFERTSYIEENGEHIDPRANDDKFEYKVKFLIKPKRPELSQNFIPNLAFGADKTIQQVIPNGKVYTAICCNWDCSSLADGDDITISFGINPINITQVAGSNLTLSIKAGDVDLGQIWEFSEGRGDFVKHIRMKGKAERGSIIVHSNNMKTLILNTLNIFKLMINKGNQPAPFVPNLIDLPTANSLIAKFNKDICTIGDNGVKTYKQLTFYNDYKHVKIVGYPKPITESEVFWRDSSGLLADVAEVELTICVNNPTLCDFDTRATKALEEQTKQQLTTIPL